MTVQAVSSPNQFAGTIREVLIGDVVSEIDVETPAGILTATVNTRSINEAGFHVGSQVLVLINATKVAIATL